MKKLILLAFLILVFCLLASSLSAQTRVSYVRFKFSYRLGENKSNDFYKIGQISGNLSESFYLIGYPTNLTHFYVCTYDEEEFEGGALVSLIYSGKKQDLSYISFLARNEDYDVEIKQKVEGTSFIIAFTNGTCKQVEKKIFSVEKYNLPSQAFSVHSKDRSLITLILANDKVVIEGSGTLNLGTNRVCVEHSGITQENKPIVKVEKC
ncbi:MAG: hypothetical protein NZ942_01085 [Candidatus Aenigmarchaeota archaeon]|nr:hypothetical protein [Candidatus Aenigmarchaeota archaeon]